MLSEALVRSADPEQAVLVDVDLLTARRQLQRVILLDFLAPTRDLRPLPVGAFARLELAADDYRLAAENAEPGGPRTWPT